MTGRVLRFSPRPPAPRESAPKSGPAPEPAQPVDAERFRRMVLPHLDGAYSFARFLCRDAVMAEDVVQEAFLKAYRGFGGFRGEDARAWLYAIVRNCVFSTARPAAVADIAEHELVDADDTPEEAVVRRSEIETVRAAIAALPEPFRETLVLRELEELSYREVAAVTGAPIGTVMSRLARARGMLLAVLGGEDQEGPR